MSTWEEEYQAEEKLKEKLAEKIWSSSFFTGLLKFTKKELLILVESILNRLAFDYEHSWTDLDIKDVFFEQKCWLIETLNPEFFKKEK